MSKENFKVTSKEDGKEYWISRALTVVGCILTVTEQKEFKFLFEVRGEGCPDNVGKLAFPCGYLNWDETLEQAVRREIYEEIGLDLSNSEVIFWKIMDNPEKDTRQNVSVRFSIYCEDLEVQLEELKKAIHDSAARGGEKEEVSDLLLLSVEQIKNMPDEAFAFNHKDAVLEFMEELEDAKGRYESEKIYHPTNMD